MDSAIRLLAVFLVTISGVLSSRSVQADLVAYYSFDVEHAGDSSGNGNDGLPSGGVTFPADAPAAIGGGRSAAGDGTGLIRVSNSASLELMASEITVAFWVKADPVANPNWVRLMLKGEEGNDGTPAWIINRNNNSSNAVIRIDSEPAGFNQNRGNGGVVFDSTWHHLVYTLDNGTFEEWIDGVRTANGTYADAPVSNSSAFVFLGRPSQPLTGQIDDLSLWSHRLQQGEIELLAQGTSALSLIPNDNPFRILGIVRNPDNTVTLTWVSDPRPGTSYTVRYSPAFTDRITDWPDDNDVVLTGGETTTYTTDNTFNEARMFFVVEENARMDGG